MTISLSPVQASKIATCPHGMPPGACPICSGAGGGGASAKKADFSAKAGEMSWADCAAMGQVLKNQAMAKTRNEQTIQSQILSAINFEKSVASFAQRITNFVLSLQSHIPPALAKPIEFLAIKLLVPMLNILKDIPLNIHKTVAQIAEKIVDISDKLAAMYGELKNSIEKKISDKLKDFKKKVSSFFGLFEPKEIDEEENKHITRHAELISASDQHSLSGKILKQVQDDKVRSTKRKLNDED